MKQNLFGQKFNRYTVIGGPETRNKKTYWECECDCGTIKWVRADQLKSGTTKSCGCYRVDTFIENNKKRQTADLTNKRFGKLIAICPTDNRKDGRVVWQCMCDCGNIYYCDSHSLQLKRVSSCGCMRSYGETKIEQLLRDNNIPYETQKRFNECRFEDTNHMAIFDFYIDNKYLIEYDGEQHFYYKNNPHTWNTANNFEKTKEHDNYKTNWCLNNNIPLIRIPYTHLNELCIEDLLLDTTKFLIEGE